MERILNQTLDIPRPLSEALTVVIFALLMVLGAFVYLPLPFTPVPLTLQTLVVLISAAALGRRAALAIVLYLISGAAGLPVFAGAWGGLARIFGPTGGYLMGFVFAALSVGWVAESRRLNTYGLLAAMLGGALLILVLGTIRLSWLFRIDLIQAFYLGMLPFILGDLIKAILAWLAVLGWQRIKILNK